MGVAYRRLDKIELIAVHHTASPRKTTVDEITAWHMAPPNNFDRCGYNYVIVASGHVVCTRQIDVIPAAQRSQNRRSIAIAVTGDNTRPAHRWTATQEGALSRLIAQIRAVLGRRIPIYGHKDLPGQHTACPGLSTREVETLA